jgi:curved DNA-binding protein CbpA
VEAAADAYTEVDLYQVLGVSPGATADQIRAAYRRRAKQCHPDTAGGSHKRMVELAAAYAVLSDPAKRVLYDQSRAAPQDAGAAAQWEAVQAEAVRQAERYPRDWAEFTRWADQVANEVHSTRGGRLASGAVAGALVGTPLGAAVGAWAGIGFAAGTAVGGIVGALGGAYAAWSQASQAKTAGTADAADSGR